MTDPSPITVIGSGPAGATVARALIEAGIPVRMIDAGDMPPTCPTAERPSLATLRAGGPGTTQFLLGDDLSGLRDMREYSPKLRSAKGSALVAGYAEANRIAPDNFNLVGMLSLGGLSNIWGAVVSVFDEDDLKEFPITAADLRPHYQEIAGKMGISGVAITDDMAEIHGAGLALQPPLPLSPATKIVMDRYGRTKRATDFRLGRSRNAVLTEALGTRSACTEDMACMWGCNRGAIYNSANDIAALMATPRFRYQGGTLVHRLTQQGNHYCIQATDRSGIETKFESKTVILAAGTLASTRLVLDFLGKVDAAIPLLNTPAVAMAFWVPARIGKPLPSTGFGMAQASFRVYIPDLRDTYALGLLYAGESIGAPDLIARMPTTRRGSIRILRNLLSGLLIGIMYFSSEFSRNQARLRREPNGNTTLTITGGRDPQFQAIADKTIRRVAKELRRAGAWLLPGSAQPYPPGSEVHYGGTLPMGTASTAYGEITGATGLYVVDGSVLPRLPAKHHTFTIMANARRIGKHIAELAKG